VAQLAEEEKQHQGRNTRTGATDESRGPPPVAKSRFAAAAAMAEGDRWNDPSDRRGPPVPQNSRFAAAAAADADYVDREERMQQRSSNNTNEDRRGFRSDNFRSSREERSEPRREEPSRSSRVDEVLKPKAPPVVDNILVPPVKLDPQHEANILKIPDKALSKRDEEYMPAPKAKVDVTPEPEEEEVPVDANVNQEELLEEFCKGNMQGEELAEWVKSRKSVIPPLDGLVFRLLTDHEKLNPDPNCDWASPSRFGAALLAIAEDNLIKQMEILFGIQKYCNKLGFPKLDQEYVIQSMFRSMYKFDLALEDAFLEWKEDESDEYNEGKITAVIQTVDWFNWLEADEEDDEEEEENEGEEEE
jgi:hypothetical protein